MNSSFHRQWQSYCPKLQTIVTNFSQVLNLHHDGKRTTNIHDWKVKGSNCRYKRLEFRLHASQRTMILIVHPQWQYRFGVWSPMRILAGVLAVELGVSMQKGEYISVRWAMRAERRGGVSSTVDSGSRYGVCTSNSRFRRRVELRIFCAHINESVFPLSWWVATENARMHIIVGHNTQFMWQVWDQSWSIICDVVQKFSQCLNELNTNNISTMRQRTIVVARYEWM